MGKSKIKNKIVDLNFIIVIIINVNGFNFYLKIYIKK